MNTKEWKEELNKLKIEYSKDSVLTFNGGYYGEIPDKASNDIDKFVSGLLKKAIDRALMVGVSCGKVQDLKSVTVVKGIEVEHSYLSDGKRKELYLEFNITNKEEESKVH